MSSIKKILPNLLVVSSTLVLAIFLVFWNIHQYEQAEKTLSNELALHLESSINELSTKRISSFIKRVGLNAGTAIDTTINRNDVTANLLVLIDSTTEIDTVKSKFQLRSSKCIDTIHSSRFVLGDKESHGICTKNISDSLIMNPRMDLDFFSIQDNLLGAGDHEEVFALYREKLNQFSLPTEFYHAQDSLQNKEEGLKIEYNASSVLNNSDFIYFHNYVPFLYSKIAYSLLFSVFLLALVITAFVVLMKSWKQQQRMVAIKNDFIGNMTHELKTPISTVSVAIEAIKNYDVIEDKAKTNEYLDISSKELNRLSLLVDKVLKTTLLEEGESLNNLQAINMSAIVKDTLNTMQMHFKEKGVDLNTDIDDNPLFVLGDKLHLTNVVYNLIENAIKYSPEEKKITLSLKLIENQVELKVRDSGIGISFEDQKQVFDKFYRVPTNNRHNVKGHGLGLSYVKQVITELNGQIDLKSKLGEGSTFTVTLKALEV